MSAPTPPKSLLDSVENSKAEYVQLGKSGLRVSIPILGAMSIGHPGWAPWVIDEEKVNTLFPLSHLIAFYPHTTFNCINH